MHTAFIVIAALAIGIQSLLLFLAFFGPDLPYRIKRRTRHPLDSPEFTNLIAALTDAQVHDGNRMEVLTNGGCFYEAELRAIAGAQATINLEAFIFYKGEIGQKFVDALAERARAGIKIKLIIDFLGSLMTPRSYFKPILDAGGELRWYHSLRLDLIPQINNRTHRELLIIDGKTGFIGGAGIADQWYKAVGKNARWRDTVCKVEGPVVTSLQSVFAQNWLRVNGEILTGDEYFHFEKISPGTTKALVVNSTPAAGSTRARTLYQLLIASARQRVYICTPYFLPDRSAREAVQAAIRECQVDVRILTPGKHADHLLTRASSRRLYGPLLKAGARIFEYQPAMIHAKILIVDDLWSVVGSTNFDHRSFELNDEVNMAVSDAAVASRLTEDFYRDLAESEEFTYEQWSKSGAFRFSAWVGAFLTKQE